MEKFDKVINFVKKHNEWFILLGLAIFCYFMFFFNIGNY